ncbi:f-box domain-containing protein [Seiridium cupressi]
MAQQAINNNSAEKNTYLRSAEWPDAQWNEMVFREVRYAPPYHVLPYHAMYEELGCHPYTRIYTLTARHDQSQSDHSTARMVPENPHRHNYIRDRSLPKNRDHEIPDELNCRLFSRNLPPDLETELLHSHIRDFGKIYAAHVYEPIQHQDPQRAHGNISTSAASLTFFSAEAANRFLARHNRTSLIIKGPHARVVRHRIRTPPVPDEGVDASRVLTTRGDPETVESLFLISIPEMEPRIHCQTYFCSWIQLEEQNALI